MSSDQSRRTLLDSLPNPKDRNLKVRQRMQAAVVHLLLHRGIDIIANGGVTKTMIADCADVGRQTVYRHFDVSTEPMSDFIIDSVRSWIQGSSFDLQSIAAHTGQLRRESRHTTFDTLVRDVATASFEHSLRDARQLAAPLLAILSMSSTYAADTIGADYEIITTEAMEVYREFLAVTRYRLRAPFDFESVAVILTALTDGMCLRALVDSHVDARLFAEAVSAFVTAVTVPESLQDGDPPNEPPPLLGGVPKVPDPQLANKIIDATVRTFARNASRNPSLTEIAAAAGVGTKTIVVHFGSVDGVIIAAWAQWIPTLIDHLDSDRIAGASAVDRLRLHLVRLAEIAYENYALTAALVRIAQGSVEHANRTAGDPRTAVPFPHLIVDILKDAALERAIKIPAISATRKSDPADLLARTVNNLFFVFILTNPCPPHQTVHRQAEWAVDYVLSVLGVDGRRS